MLTPVCSHLKRPPGRPLRECLREGTLSRVQGTGLSERVSERGRSLRGSMVCARRAGPHGVHHGLTNQPYSYHAYDDGVHVAAVGRMLLCCSARRCKCPLSLAACCGGHDTRVRRKVGANRTTADMGERMRRGATPNRSADTPLICAVSCVGVSFGISAGFEIAVTESRHRIHAAAS